MPSPLSIRVPPRRPLLSTSPTQNVSLGSLECNLPEANWLILPFVLNKVKQRLEEALLFSLENQRPSLWREAGLSYDLFIVVIKKYLFSFCELFCFLVEYDLFSRY